MSRLAQVLPSDMSRKRRELLEAITGGKRARYKLDNQERIAKEGLRGPFNSWMQAPAMGMLAQQLGDQLRFAGTLSDRQREIAILSVAVHWQSDYEWWAHKRIAAIHGVETESVDAILAGEPPLLADESERVLYEFTYTFLREHRIGDALYDAVVRQLGEATLVELVMLLGYYVMISMTLNAFEVKLPEGEASPFGSE